MKTTLLLLMGIVFSICTIAQQSITITNNNTCYSATVIVVQAGPMCSGPVTTGITLGPGPASSVSLTSNPGFTWFTAEVTVHTATGDWPMIPIEPPPGPCSTTCGMGYPWNVSTYLPAYPIVTCSPDIPRAEWSCGTPMEINIYDF